MIDPDDIARSNTNLNTDLVFKNIPEFDYIIWDYDDDKELKKYFKAVEYEVRNSFEYREMIQYIKDNYDMSHCSFLKVGKDNDIRIEVHHYPFTLYDIVIIVYRKRIYYQEKLDVQMIAKECTMLHYKLLVGLIPLSKTVHQLVHDSRLFIPVTNVLGRYNKFIELYKPFCEEYLDIIAKLEEYSQSHSMLENNILDPNIITVTAEQNSYRLPDMSNININMNNRIEQIKNNNYKLPTLEEINNGIETDSKESRRVPIKVLYFE